MLRLKEFFKGILLKGNTSDISDSEEGSAWHNSTSNRLKTYLQSAIRTLVTEDQDQTLTNKTIDADDNTITNLEHGFEVDNPSSGVHGVTGDVVGTTDTQNLTNKTLDNTNDVTLLDTNFTLQDDGDDTKQLKFDVSGLTTGNTRTLSPPDADAIILGEDTTQVITNKDIDGGDASDTNRITIPKDTKSNLDLLSRKEATLVYATDESALYADNGANLIRVGSGGITKVDFLDPTNTTLPTGVSVIFDGVSGANGDLILFSNLSSGNNKVYELSGVGVAISFTPVIVFNGSQNPTDGDAVVIRDGNAFKEQITIFNGTNWKVNDVVRLFDGVSADFWELSSIKTADLTDNTTDNIFTVIASGSENFIISYSILRNTSKETGELFLTTDGTNVALTRTNSYLNDSGVTFTAQISGSDLELDYTTTSTGFDGTMKYFVKRWSDSVGGPTGIPSYAGGGNVPAAGATGEIQYRGSSGNLDADSRFVWDETNGLLNLNGLRYEVLTGPVTFLDNQSNATAFSYTASTNKFAIIEYSIIRNTTNVQVGRLLVTTNTTTVSIVDDNTFIGTPGVTFSAIISGANVLIRYTTTSTGFNADFKYTIRRWS